MESFDQRHTADVSVCAQVSGHVDSLFIAYEVMHLKLKHRLWKPVCAQVLLDSTSNKTVTTQKLKSFVTEVLADDDDVDDELCVSVMKL